MALGFVVHAVPVRDRCADPRAAVTPSAPRYALSRSSSLGGPACTLHAPDGPLPLGAPACAELTCERGVGAVFRAADAVGLLGLLALYLAGTLAWSARWRWLLGLAGVHAPLGAVWRITLESQAGGVILPGGMGGDALRIAFALRQRDEATVSGEGRSPERATTTAVVASVLLDRVIGLVSVVTLAVVGVAALAGPALRGAVGPVLGVLQAIPFAFVVGMALAQLARRRGLLAPAAGAEASGVVAAAWRHARALLGYVGDPRAPAAVGLALLASLVNSAAQLLVVRGLVSALGGAGTVAIDEAWVLLGTTLTFLVGVIPALPGGWGTTDAAFVFFLGHAGLTPSHALAVSLVYRLFWYASAAAGALLLLVRSRGAVKVNRRSA